MATTWTRFLISIIQDAVWTTKTRRPASTRDITTLESRRLPAAIVGGNLQISGTNRSDTVIVDDMLVSGQDVVRVVQNGYTQFFSASAITGEIRFWGYKGNDIFDYAGTFDTYVDAGSGNDSIYCGDGWDYVLAGDGHDLVEGWAGDDFLYGGMGNDLLDGGIGNDELYGDSGNDLLGGGVGNDYLNGGIGNDAAFGGAGLDDFESIGSDPWYVLSPPIATRFGIMTRTAGVQDFKPADDLIIS